MGDNPFPDTIIADWTFLDSSARSQCPKCKKSRKYYCYTCYASLPHLASNLPKVKLPVKVDIIKHPGETDGKSTAPHAAILAPDDVVIHAYPCIPDYDLEKVVLVFPGEQSVTLDEIAAACSEAATLLEAKGESPSVNAEPRSCDPVSMIKRMQNCNSDLNSGLSDVHLTPTGGSRKHSLNDVEKNKTLLNFDISQRDQDLQNLKRPMSDKTDCNNGGHHVEPPSKKIKSLPRLPFEKVVFIDATWNQTHNIINDERVKNLKKVELRTRNSNFWRCQEGVPKTYLSTIEAIFYFVKDVHTLFVRSEYKHEYDNLLFFFGYIYSKIQKSSKGGKVIKT